jgi:hypothetical protein
LFFPLLKLFFTELYRFAANVGLTTQPDFSHHFHKLKSLRVIEAGESDSPGESDRPISLIWIAARARPAFG